MKQLVIAMGITLSSFCAMGQARDGTTDLKQTEKAQQTTLQIKQAQKNLIDAQNKSTSLIREGKDLEQKRQNLGQSKAYGRSYRNDLRLNKKTKATEQAIKDNLTAQIFQDKEVAMQQAALTLLLDRNRN